MMKKKKFNGIRSAGLGLLAMAALVVSSCTDHFDSLNTPSNQLVAGQLDASLLGQVFAHSQFTSMKGTPGGGGYQIGQNLFADLWSQYFATTAENFDSDQYVLVGGWANNAWNYFYNNAARSIYLVENSTAEEGMDLENAVVKVWKVFSYHRITDYWGPIIYSNFGNGERVVNYDSQEDIYRDFFSTLDEAVAVLNSNAGGTVFGAHDMIYGGNVDQWIKFANSLRLRLAMRVRFADPDLAQTEAEKAIAGGVIEDNDDNAFLLTNENSPNPMDTITNWGEFRMSATMESYMVGFDDPRTPDYWEPPAAANAEVYRGLRNGQTPAGKGPVANANYSDVDIKWQPRPVGGSNPPMRIMSASEVWFLRAEGALVGWDMDVADAQTAYEMGIRRSLEERVPDADIDAYISSTNTPAAWTPAVDVHNGQDLPPASDITVAFDASRALEQIITQKWIALYPDGIEAWAEYRRTGFPRLYPIVNSLNPELDEDSGGPRRMTFVDNEFANNRAAVEAAQGLLNGPDSPRTRMWWDQNPDALP